MQYSFLITDLSFAKYYSLKHTNQDGRRRELCIALTYFVVYYDFISLLEHIDSNSCIALDLNYVLRFEQIIYTSFKTYLLLNTYINHP